MTVWVQPNLCLLLHCNFLPRTRSHTLNFNLNLGFSNSMAAAAAATTASSSSSSRMSCFQCQDSGSNPDHFRNGWRLRSGEHAQLCPRCAWVHTHYVFFFVLVILMKRFGSYSLMFERISLISRGGIYLIKFGCALVLFNSAAFAPIEFLVGIVFLV